LSGRSTDPAAADRDSQAIREWKDIVAISGRQGLRLIKGFNDEGLSGEWKGHRSSRLGQQYRVIYRIERGSVLVEVVSITAHDYRRK
jgi:addiction module RelE/StbE family toxin